MTLGVACSSAPPRPEPTVVTEVPAPVSPAPVLSGYVRVTASGLNVRRDPSTAAAVIAKVKRGDRLTVVTSADAWMKVRLPSGELGWVASQHVRRDEEIAASRPGRRGCPADSDFRFAKAPTPSFSDRGAHGLVIVEANVDARGNVTGTTIISNTTGDIALGLVAEREIRGAKFVAPIRDCAPRAFLFTYKRTF